MSQFRAIADPELEDIRTCLHEAGFAFASGRGDIGIGEIQSNDLSYYYAEAFELNTPVGLYRIGIAPNRRWVRGWVGTLSGFGTGFLWGGQAQGTVGLVAAAGRGESAFIAERRKVAGCVFSIPAASGPRRFFADWHRRRCSHPTGCRRQAPPRG